MERFKNTVKQTRSFLETDLWQIGKKDLRPATFFLVRVLRIISLTASGFPKHLCGLRASALTFYTVLSIVPLLAMAFGVAKGFGFENMLERQLYQNLPGQEEVLNRIMEMARTLLEQTRGGAIAGIGMAMLIWTAVKVLNHIETSLNEIWDVKEARPFQRKLSDYLAIMFTSPILAIVSSGLTVFISIKVAAITQDVALLGVISPLIHTLLKLLSYALIWALFTLTYLIMPNTGVNMVSALIGGIIAGSIYRLAQWIYIDFQIGVAGYNAIYGSFAALPLFLVWVQVSWLIMLLGAEISSAHQNMDDYPMAPSAPEPSFSLKKLASLGVIHLLASNFFQGRPPLTAREIADETGIHLRLVRLLLDEFVAAGILSRTMDQKNGDPAFQPARDVRDFTIKNIIDTLEHFGADDPLMEKSDTIKALSKALKRFEDASASLVDNQRLADIKVLGKLSQGTALAGLPNAAFM